MEAAHTASVIPLRRLPMHLSSFSYRIPETVRKEVQVGSVVRIPFKNQIITGVVHDMAPITDQRRLKDIAGVTAYTLTKQQLALVDHLALLYVQSPAQIIRSFLTPPPLKSRETTVLVPTTEPSDILSRKIKQTIANGYVLYRSYQDLVAYMITSCKQQKGGQVVIVSPEHRHVRMLASALGAALPKSSILMLPSKQKKNEFFSIWEKSTRADIVIGTLPVLFLPFSRLRRILVIEAEHRQFQHAEQSPRYHLADFVDRYAAVYQSSLLRTGFSPDIRLLHTVEKNNERIQQIGGSPREPVIIDLAEDRRAGNFGIVSEEVRLAMAQTRGRTLCILNRHGIANSLRCSNCDLTVQCPDCFQALGVSESTTQMRCPRCTNLFDTPERCTQCNGESFVTRGIGVQALARDCRRMFPERSIGLFTSDTGSKVPPDTDIVIATSRILSYAVAGFESAIIVRADDELHYPNFHAAESLRHLIAKVGSLAQTVYVQTFDPSHYVYRTLGSVRAFYDEEIRWRKQLSYPPFATIISLTIKDRDRDALAAKRIKLVSLAKSIDAFGPFDFRIGSLYGSRLIIKSKEQHPSLLDQFSRDDYTWLIIEINPYSIT